MQLCRTLGNLVYLLIIDVVYSIVDGRLIVWNHLDPVDIDVLLTVGVHLPVLGPGVVSPVVGYGAVPRGRRWRFLLAGPLAAIHAVRGAMFRVATSVLSVVHRPLAREALLSRGIVPLISIFLRVTFRFTILVEEIAALWSSFPFVIGKVWGVLFDEGRFARVWCVSPSPSAAPASLIAPPASRASLCIPSTLGESRRRWRPLLSPIVVILPEMHKPRRQYVLQSHYKQRLSLPCVNQNHWHPGVFVEENMFDDLWNLKFAQSLFKSISNQIWTTKIFSSIVVWKLVSRMQPIRWMQCKWAFLAWYKDIFLL